MRRGRRVRRRFFFYICLQNVHILSLLCTYLFIRIKLSKERKRAARKTKMMLVAQWKNYRWVNFYDEDGNTRYFKNIEEVKEFLKTRHFNREVDVRICEYLGGRSYREIEAPKAIKNYH